MRVYGDCLVGVRRPSSRCGEAVWRVWGRCVEGEGKDSIGCGEAVWKLWWGSCLVEAVWWVWGDCLEVVERLFGVS